MEVISKSHAHRDVSERLLQQIAADFEKAQQFCESPSELGVLEATEVKWLTLYIYRIHISYVKTCVTSLITSIYVMDTHVGPATSTQTHLLTM